MLRPLLVLNAGSSSLKFAIYDCCGEMPLPRASGAIEDIGSHARLWVRDSRGFDLRSESVEAPDQACAVSVMLRWASHQVGGNHRFGAVAHRVVHGGSVFNQPALIDDAVLAQLDALVPFAPLHQPQALAAIRALRDRVPEVPQVACFDTAFHAVQPWVARAYALPRRYEAEGLVRYGFHGLSYQSIVWQLRRRVPMQDGGRLIVAHLGNGGSLCAIDRGRSVATTMGLTPLDGIPMSTRCGALDPGVLLHLMRRHGLDANAAEDLLYRQSGLLGVSGLSGDVRDLLISTDSAAVEALELFIYRIAREIGSLAAALQGIDRLVFTGGIGEHRPEIRSRVCAALRWLGVKLDPDRHAAGEELISADDSAVPVHVMHSDENGVVARLTLQLLRESGAPDPAAPRARRAAAAATGNR